MSEPATSTEARAAAFAQAMAAEADLWFNHDGLIYFCVPWEVVQAYAAARVKRLPGPAAMRAMMVAFAGEETFHRHQDDADWVFWRIARAWAWRLGAIERSVRGLSRSAA